MGVTTDTLVLIRLHNKADQYWRPKLTAQKIERFVLMSIGLNSIKSSNYSFWKFFLNPPIILEIIPTKLVL